MHRNLKAGLSSLATVRESVTAAPSNAALHQMSTIGILHTQFCRT